MQVIEVKKVIVFVTALYFLFSHGNFYTTITYP